MEDKSMPKPKYYTPVEGMTGTGEPVVAPGAQSTDQKLKPEALTGGAFSGMQVTKEIMEQIEAGSASDFLYFTESKEEPGLYDMHTKLPEYGCGGPGQPVFKMRENVNRLMKGTAKKFLGEDGQPDMDKGLHFLQEFQNHFGLSGIPMNPDVPMETDIEMLRENATEWLCDEMEIPLTERNSFKDFCKASISFGNELKPIGFNNYFSLWQKYVRNQMTLDEMKSMENSPFTGIEAGGNADNVFQKNIDGYANSVQQLRALSEIDPVTEKRMIVPNECEGSMHFIKNVVKSAHQANIELGKEKEKDAVEAFAIDIDQEMRKIRDRPAEIQKEIDVLTEEKGKENAAAKQEEIEKQITEKKEELKTAEEAAKKAPKKDDLKWERHFAGVMGSFTTGEGDQKKTWYLTAEAFAPESDMLVEHPGITDEVSIGIYSGAQDFLNYYMKDNAGIAAEQEDVKKFIQIRDEKTPGIMERMEDLIEEVDREPYAIYRTVKPFRTEYKNAKDQMFEERKSASMGELWEKKRARALSGGKYVPSAGSREGLDNDEEIGLSEHIRAFTAKRSGVPEQYRTMYDHMLRTVEKTYVQSMNAAEAHMVHLELIDKWEEDIKDLEKNSEWVDVRDRNGNITDHSRDLQKKKEELEKLNQFADDYAKKHDVAELEIKLWNTVLKKVAKGKGFNIDEDFPSQGEAALFRILMKNRGLEEKEFLSFLDGVSKNMGPVNEARLEIQAGHPDLSAGFLGKDNVKDLTEPELEFATQNMDSMLNVIFSQEDKQKMTADREDIADRVYIEGKSIDEIIGNKFADVKDADRLQALKKAEALRLILQGKQADVLRGYKEENGIQVQDRIPVNLVSSEKNIAPIVAKINYAPKEPETVVQKLDEPGMFDSQENVMQPGEELPEQQPDPNAPNPIYEELNALEQAGEYRRLAVRLVELKQKNDAFAMKMGYCSVQEREALQKYDEDILDRQLPPEYENLSEEDPRYEDVQPGGDIYEKCPPKKGAATVKALYDEMLRYATELQVQAGKIAQVYDEKIKNGEYPQIGGLKDDERARNQIANGLTAGSDVAKKLSAVNLLKGPWAMVYSEVDLGTDGKHLKGSDYLSGKAVTERQMQMLKDHYPNDPKAEDLMKRGGEIAMGKTDPSGLCGVKVTEDRQVVAPENLTEVTVKRFESSRKKSDKCLTTVEEMMEMAGKKYAELKKLDTGNRSDEFRKMVNDLEKLSSLTPKSSPQEIRDAIREMGESAFAYRKRIDSSKTRGVFSTGQARRNIADEMYNSMKQYTEKLDGVWDELEKDRALAVQVHEKRLLDQAYQKQAAQAVVNVAPEEKDNKRHKINMDELKNKEPEKAAVPEQKADEKAPVENKKEEDKAPRRKSSYSNLVVESQRDNGIEISGKKAQEKKIQDTKQNRAEKRDDLKVSHTDSIRIGK